MSATQEVTRSWQPPRWRRRRDKIHSQYREAYSYARFHAAVDDEDNVTWAAQGWHVDWRHQEFLNQCAQECRCCPDCSEFPCAGVQTSGFCESLTCICGDDDYEYWGHEP
ncbi:MAG: hypothetical protein AAFV53_13110 [Myxococcota bacterium]